MRIVRYAVASSLDGYIADADGGYDWIVQDPDVDFGEMFARYDTFLMGRVTYELTQRVGTPGIEGRVVVASRTLRQSDHPQATIVDRDIESVVRQLKQAPGKDIWLFGGGQLFATLVAAHVVDEVEVAVIPVILGSGIPLAPGPLPRVKLSLKSHHIYAKSGIVMLTYLVVSE
jgi:dihydrofolate reductase